MMQVTEFVARTGGVSLRGFATVEMASGLVIHDVSIHQRDGSTWASPPAKPMLGRDGTQMRGKDGKALWAPIISFAAKATRDRWSAQVIAALHVAHPEVMG